MPVFEIETPDGLFEVEAPDENTALQALGTTQPGQPSQAFQQGLSELSGITQGFDKGQGKSAFRSVDSAIRGAADMLSLGMSDEIAALGNSTVDAMMGTPGQYNRRLRQERITQEIRDRQDPVASTVGRVAGALGGGLGLARSGLSLSANAANAGHGLGRTAIASGLEGAALGGAHGFGSGEGMEDRIAGAKSGAKWGGVFGAGSPFAVAGITAAGRRALTPFKAPAERTAATQVLNREGVNLTAGQKTGSKGLRYAESEIGGKVADDIMESQAEQFTAAALKRAGIDANRAMPEVIDEAFTRIGSEFDQLAANNRMVVDKKFLTELRDAFNEYGQLVPESMRAPVITGVTNDIVKAAKQGHIPGEAYKALRSRLDRAARSSARDPELSQALRNIKDVLDEAMERGIAKNNPNALGAWKNVRRQYRNMLVIERAATGAGENAAQGIISPSALRNATVTKQGRRNYARGQGDFAELARAGEATMKPMPNSGTAGRLRAQNLGALGPLVVGGSAGGAYGAQEGGLEGALMGAALGAAAPRIAGRAMMSRPLQAYLANQAFTGQGINPNMLTILNNSGSGALARRR